MPQPLDHSPVCRNIQYAVRDSVMFCLLIVMVAVIAARHRNNIAALFQFFRQRSAPGFMALKLFSTFILPHRYHGAMPAM